MITKNQYIEVITNFTKNTLSKVWERAYLEYTHSAICRFKKNEITDSDFTSLLNRIGDSLSPALSLIERSYNERAFDGNNNVFVNLESGEVFLSLNHEAEENEVCIGDLDELYNLCIEEIYQHDGDVLYDGNMEDFILNSFFPNYKELARERCEVFSLAYESRKS